MDYELAKQLKEAGFPDISWFSLIVNGSTDEIRYQMPALSELIEACGDEFLYLKKYLAGDGHQWEASGNTKIGEYDMFFVGKSPEEAVAKLWLELNK